MDIAETFARFAQEQTDAYNPDHRTRHNAFGEPIDTPTVEGYDQWGDAHHYTRQIEAQKLARRQDAEHAHALALIQQHKDAARRRCNMLMRVRRTGK